MIPTIYSRLTANFPAIDPTAKIEHTRIGTITPIVHPPKRMAHENPELRCKFCGAKLIPHDEGFVCPRCGTVYPTPVETVEPISDEKSEKMLASSRKAIFEHDHAEWYVVFKVILDDPFLANKYKHEAETVMRKLARHLNRLPRSERIPFLHYFVIVSYLVLSRSPRVTLRGRELFDKVFYAFSLMRPPFPILRHVKIKKADVLESVRKLLRNAPEEWMKEELRKVISEESTASLFDKI